MFSSIQFNRIKGLTLSYPELGKIKIGQLGQERTSQGGTKYRLPEKLDHFRITLRVRDQSGQFALDEELHKSLGPEPKELNVTLVYDDPTLNCPSRLNCYDGSRRWCHGNGEQALRLDAQGIYRERDCPCSLLSSPEESAENKGKPKNQIIRCKPYGVLRVQLPDKHESIGVYGFRTTSAETISNILAVQASILMHTGGVLGGISLRLRIYPATDNTPGGPSRSWKVTLDLPPGGWAEVDEAAKRIVQARLTTRYDMKAIEAAHRKALAAVVEHPEDAEEIIDELFPKPITVVNGVEVMDAEPEGDGDGNPPIEIVTKPEPEPQAHADPSAASSAPPAPEPPPDEDPNLKDEVAFREALEAEAQAKGDLATAFIAKQVGILKSLMLRKGFVQTATSWARDGKPLTEPLEKFDRNKRMKFCEHLLKLPDAVKIFQEEIPW